MTRVVYHILSKPNMPSTKAYEFETSYGRKGVINRKYPLNELVILHVHANEAQHTKAMERLSNDWDCSRAARAHILYFQKRHIPGSSGIFLQSRDSRRLP